MDEIKEYCHYIFSSDTIGNVLGAMPKRYSSTKIILKEFDSIMGFQSQYWRRFNIDLIDAINTVQVIDCCRFDSDAGRLYDSVLSRMGKIYCGVNECELDYELLFDILADYLWVIASYYRDPNCNTLSLTTSQDDVLTQSKHFLEVWQANYQSELDNVAEMENVLSQSSFKKTFFIGLQSESFQRYLGDQTPYGLKLKIQEQKSVIRKHQYLFYALCATNVKYKSLLKGMIK